MIIPIYPFVGEISDLIFTVAMDDGISSVLERLQKASEC